MTEATIIGLDLAKNVFQAHGARADGSVAFRIKLVRTKVLAFFAAQPTCTVAMEACASAHIGGNRWQSATSGISSVGRLLAVRATFPRSLRMTALGLKREFPESLAPTAEPQRLGKAVSFLKVAFPSEGKHEALRCTQSKPGSGAMSEYGGGFN